MHFPHEHRGSYFTSYRNGDWKLIYWYNPEHPQNPYCELYNLLEDPYETNNLAEDEQNILNRLIGEMSIQLLNEGALYPEDESGKILKPFEKLK